MAKMQIPQKLRVEDFESEDQKMAEAIGNVVNSAFEEIYQILNGNVDYINLNRQVVDVNVKINAAGKVMNSPQIKLTVKGKPRGVVTLAANNVVNTAIYPTGTPFVSWTLNAGILTILNVAGLQPQSEYRLTLEIIV